MRRKFTAVLGALACLALAGSPALAAEPAESKAPAGLKVREGDVIAIYGDSITCGFYPGYVDTYLLVCRGLKDIRVQYVAQFGYDVDYLLEHMGSSVLPYKPTVVTLCLGMNGSGKGATLIQPDGDKAKARFVGLMEQVIDRLQAAGARTVFLGSSSPTDTDTMRNRTPTNEDSPSAIAANKSLAILRDAYRDLAGRKPGVVWVSVFDDFTAAMAKAKTKYARTYHVAGSDGVHPSANGNLCIAYSFLRALGCDGNIGTVTLDLATGKAEASEGHKVLPAEGGAVQLESSRYPFCFYPDKAGSYATPETPASIRTCLPFSEDLNRFLLVVKGVAAGKKYRVAWGSESRVFEGSQLAEGINLADVFATQTPFQNAFQKFDAAVGQRRTSFGKLHSEMLKWDGKSPKTEGHKAMEDRLARSEEALTKAFLPVKHTIQVKPAE